MKRVVFLNPVYWLGVLVLCGMPSTVMAQESSDGMPDTLAELIDFKGELLEQFRRQSEAGASDEVLKTLQTIVKLHRKAHRLAVDRETPENIAQLEQVYLDDGEFLVNQLFDKGKYADSGAVARELSEFLESKQLESANPKQKVLQFHAQMMERLDQSQPEQQAAFLAAHQQFEQATTAASQGDATGPDQFGQAVEVCTKIVGDDFPYVAIRLGRWARMLWEIGRFPEARLAYERALAAREATLGRDLEYAALAFNLGRVCQELQDFPAAEGYYLRTAEIEKEKLGELHSAYSDTLKYLAGLYQSTGDSEKLAAIQQSLLAADPLNTLLRRLPENAFAAALAEPAALTRQPELNDIPFELIETWGLQEIDLNPWQVNAIVGYLVNSAEGDDPGWGVMFRLEPGQTYEGPWRNPNKSQARKHPSGATHYVSTGPEDIAAAECKDGVFIIGSRKVVIQTLAEDSQPRLAELILSQRGTGQVQLAVDIEKCRDKLQTLLVDEGRLSAPWPDLSELIQGLQGWQGTLDFSEGLDVAMSFRTAQQGAEQDAVIVLDEIWVAARQTLEARLGEMQAATEDSYTLASLNYLQRVLNQKAIQMQAEVSPGVVSYRINLSPRQFLLPSMMGMMMPTLGNIQGGAEGMKTMNNFRTIGLALHNYYDANGTFPPRYSVDKNGRPLLSWRVLILPFLDEVELYNEFHMDEPWDSPHNLKLAERMPNYFSSPAGAGDPRLTRVVVPVGKDLAFEDKRGLKIAEIVDGSSNTVLFVECRPSAAVIWTQPADLPWDPTQPAEGLAEPESSEFLGTFVDGAVRLVPLSLEKEVLRNLFLRNDGNPIPIF